MRSGDLMQSDAGKININVESYVEVVGEDIQCNMSDDFGDLSIRQALVAERLDASRPPDPIRCLLTGSNERLVYRHLRSASESVEEWQ
jgi:hypothetical protein